MKAARPATMPMAPAPVPILFAPAVGTAAGDEVGATTVFVAVDSKLVRAGAEADAESPPPPRAVLPDRNVDGEGVLTNTVVEVTVLEEPGRVKVVRDVVGIPETPGTPGTLEVPGTPGSSVEIAPGMLKEALEVPGMAVTLRLG